MREAYGVSMNFTAVASLATISLFSFALVVNPLLVELRPFFPEKKVLFQNLMINGVDCASPKNDEWLLLLYEKKELAILGPVVWCRTMKWGRSLLRLDLKLLFRIKMSASLPEM